MSGLFVFFLVLLAVFVLCAVAMVFMTLRILKTFKTFKPTVTVPMVHWLFGLLVYVLGIPSFLLDAHLVWLWFLTIAACIMDALMLYQTYFIFIVFNVKIEK